MRPLTDTRGTGSLGSLLSNAAVLEDASSYEEIEVDDDNVYRYSNAYKQMCAAVGTTPTYTDVMKKARFVQRLVDGCTATHLERDGAVTPAKWKPVYPFSRKLRRAIGAVMRRQAP